LLGWEHAAGDQPIGRRATDVQYVCRFIEGYLTALASLPFLIDSNAIGFPKTADMGACPSGAMPCHFTGAIQNSRDRIVWQLPRQHTNEVNDIGLDCPAGLSDLVLLDRQLGMIAALPMDDEGQRITDDVDDNLVDKQPDNLLACFDRRARAIPCFGQVPAHGHQFCAIFSRER